jgi:hypothetical protein
MEIFRLAKNFKVHPIKRSSRIDASISPFEKRLSAALEKKSREILEASKNGTKPKFFDEANHYSKEDIKQSIEEIKKLPNPSLTH